MSSFRFEMNSNWKHELNRAIDGEMRKLTANLQRTLDRLRMQYKGKPIAQIKPALQRAWAQATPGGKITDPELTAYAEAIHAGTPIKLQYKGIK